MSTLNLNLKSTMCLSRKHKAIHHIIMNTHTHTCKQHRDLTSNEDRLATATAFTQSHFHVKINIPRSVWRGGRKGGK